MAEEKLTHKSQEALTTAMRRAAADGSPQVAQIPTAIPVLVKWRRLIIASLSPTGRRGAPRSAVGSARAAPRGLVQAPRRGKPSDRRHRPAHR